MNSNRNKATLAVRIRSLIAGTQKHLPNGSLTLGGVTFTTASLVQTLQGLGDAIAAVDAARASWEGALLHERDEHAKVDPVIRAYQSWIVATYGNVPSTLADYGVTPRKVPTPLTADQLVAAVAKRVATRKARHTMGTRQKSLITGAPAQPIAPAASVTATTGSPATPPPVKPA